MAKLDKFLDILKLFNKTDNAKPIQDAHVNTRVMDGPAEGYIYNILDTKKGKNYIGSKLGAIDKTQDYLGSGTIIKNISKKRPDDLYKTILGKTSTRREMMTQEEAFLKAYRAAQDDNMYNLKNSYNGKLGHVVTEETKKKIIATTKGRPGKLHTPEAKRKISEAGKGRTPWNKGKKGVQVGANKGKKFSEESKRKMSESHKGQKAWNKGKKTSEEVKRKQSEAHKGKAMSEESKRKMSESQKKRLRGLL